MTMKAPDKWLTARSRLSLSMRAAEPSLPPSVLQRTDSREMVATLERLQKMLRFMR
jgi:hypothetical protein